MFLIVKSYESHFAEDSGLSHSEVITLETLSNGVVRELNNNYFQIQNTDSYSHGRANQTETMCDFGPEPFVVDITKATLHNNTFRTALWTGNHLQLTLMSIPVGECIGLEMHPNVDQFLRIEGGQGLVQMGASKDNLNIKHPVYDDFAIFIPAGTWHNVTNTGNKPLKLYSIYAPPNHPWGVVQKTKADDKE